MSDANQYEQQMLDLINADRAAAGLNPLVFNGDLNESSEDHSAWMLETDSFSHRGADGSSSRDRIEDAGYELEGRWLTGENIAWVNEAGENGLSDEVIRLHTNLMNSPEHRANLMNPEFKEIGIGIETGDFVDNGQPLDAVFVTQNFGTTSANTVVLPEDTAPVEAPAPLAEDAPAAPSEPAVTSAEMPEATPEPTFDIAQFMADRGIPMRILTDGEATESFTSTVQTSTSSIEVTSVASEADGPSVEVEGEGNFSGGGGATVDSVTVMETASGASPVSEPIENAPSSGAEVIGPMAEETSDMPASTATAFDFEAFILGLGSDAELETVTSTSSVEVTSVASEANGPSVNVEGEGNFSGGGTASVADMTAETLLADQGFDLDNFVFNFGPNATVESGSTISSGVVRSVANQDDGPMVEFLEMQGNVDLTGFARVEDDVQSEMASSSAFDMSNPVASFGATFFDEFSF